MKKHNLYQFIPLRRPTIDDEKDNTISICYYHNQNIYDIVYSNYPEYIMYPNIIIESQLDELYEAHGLAGWYDSRSNILVEDSDEDSDEE